MAKNFLNRIFGEKMDNGTADSYWAARLSFEQSRLDRTLLEKIFLEVDPNLDAFSYVKECLNISYDTPISLAHELNLVNRYVELWKSVDENIRIDISISNENEDVSVPPFILFPLLQNACQVTHFMSEKRPIKCRISAMNNVLQMEVSNRVNPYIQSQSDTETMLLFRSRLKRTYSDNYELIINSNTNLFRATLRLKLSVMD